MFCSRCGKEIREGQVFCGCCGARVGDAPYVENHESIQGDKSNTVVKFLIGACVILSVIAIIIFSVIFLKTKNKGNAAKETGNGSNGVLLDKDGEEDNTDTEADNVDWKKLYIDYVEDMSGPGFDSTDYLAFALIDFDKNGIPELVCNICDMQFAYIVYLKDSVLVEKTMGLEELFDYSFSEYNDEGLIYIQEPISDEGNYNELICKFDGEYTKLHVGRVVDYYCYEGDEPVCIWDDEEVSYDEYKELLSEAYTKGEQLSFAGGPCEDAYSIYDLVDMDDWGDFYKYNQIVDAISEYGMKTDSVSDKSGNMKDVLSAYEQYATDVMNRYDFDDVLYKLVYVDDDDIPECVARFEGKIMLLIYRDGEVISVPDAPGDDWWEYIAYKERTGEVAYIVDIDRYSDFYYYKIDNGEVELISVENEPSDILDAYEYCLNDREEGCYSVWAAADAHGIQY